MKSAAVNYLVHYIYVIVFESCCFYISPFIFIPTTATTMENEWTKSHINELSTGNLVLRKRERNKIHLSLIPIVIINTDMLCKKTESPSHTWKLKTCILKLLVLT